MRLDRGSADAMPQDAAEVLRQYFPSPSPTANRNIGFADHRFAQQVEFYGHYDRCYRSQLFE